MRVINARQAWVRAMPTGRSSELEKRFGIATADAIAAAYLAALEAVRLHDLDTETRLALVQALIIEAEKGRTDATHLRDVALTFVPPS